MVQAPHAVPFLPPGPYGKATPCRRLNYLTPTSFITWYYWMTRKKKYRQVSRTSACKPARILAPAQRAEQHVHALRQALSQKQWRDAYRICFDEFQDMHALFHNACPPFSYMNDAARQLLTRMQMHWDDCGDGPLITMDAGPNIHLLFRGDQHDFAQHYMQALREHHHVI